MWHTPYKDILVFIRTIPLQNIYKAFNKNGIPDYNKKKQKYFISGNNNNNNKHIPFDIYYINTFPVSFVFGLFYYTDKELLICRLRCGAT